MRTIAGRYELDLRLGESTWRATDTELGREVLVRFGAPRVAAALSLLVASLVAAGSTPAHGGASDLAGELERALAAPGIAPGLTAALAVDLETGRVVYEQHAETALLPASAEKLAEIGRAHV